MRDEFDPDWVARNVDDHHELDPEPPLDQREPALLTAAKVSGAIVSLVVLAGLTGIIPSPTPEQQAQLSANLIQIIVGVISVVSIVQALVQGYLTRRSVVSPATAERLAEANTTNGYAQGVSGREKPNPILPLF